MASLSHLNFSASFPICVCSPSSMFPAPFQKPCQPTKPKRHEHVFKVSCHGNNLNNNPTNRRDVLIGLGGLCGATTLSSNNHSAFAAPVSTPDLTTCVPPIILDPDYNCCPPRPPSPVIDFQFPPRNACLRVRQPAHLVSDKYIAKYKEAVKLMKALPPDDPRNFTQQANVHCAYCDGGYYQLGFPDRELQVHASWLFFPFHRWYLYFYERILGSLIGDPTFALPFWNWDAPDGMKIPNIYTDQRSPLYDPLRNPRHQPPVIVDLDYDPDHDHSGEDPKKQIETNLSIMYRQVVSRGKSPSLFLGKPYHAGSSPNPGAGSLELVPHNTVHTWTGTELTVPFGVDMGQLYSAARDSIFFAHHSNVDRMWNIWKTEIPGGRRKDFTDDDWLESNFLFYDENKNLVRVKVKDCLDSRKLGYDYDQSVCIPWINSKPTRKYPRPATKQASEVLQFPLTLNSIARTTVNRPKHESGSQEEKEEVLVIDIEYDNTSGVKFDVFINDQDDDQIGTNDAEFAGSFVSLPHSHRHGDESYKKTSTSFSLGITDLLEEIEVKDDDSIVVTMVPRYGGNPATIKAIEIKLAALDDESI